MPRDRGPLYYGGVTAETVPQAPHIADSVPGEAQRQVILTRWVTLAEASRMLRVSEVALRKRLASGHLTGLRVGRSWRILLPGDLWPEEEPTEQPAAADPREPAEVLARTSESLVAVVRDLQRQSLALAAQIGYLQKQLQEARERSDSLAQRLEERQEAITDTSAGESGHTAEVDELRATLQIYQQEFERRKETETPAKRPRWRFWRR